MADYNPNQFEPLVRDGQRRITLPDKPAVTSVEPKKPERRCPDGGALIVRGAWYPCDFMDQMSPESGSHTGWPHGNREAEAIWQ